MTRIPFALRTPLRAITAAALLSGAFQAHACRTDGLSSLVQAPGQMAVTLETDFKEGSLPTDFYARWEGGLTAARLPDMNGRLLTPHRGIGQIDSLLLRARVFPNMGNTLAFEFGLLWKYPPDFVSTAVDGKTYYLSRKALEKYPDLLARFKAARINFDKVEVTFGADIAAPNGSVYRESMVFTLPRAAFIVPNEGDGPFASPATPDKWADRLAISRPDAQKGWASEEELPGIWRRLVAVRCPTVTFWNLRVPHEELERIAKKLMEYEKDGLKAQRDEALLNEGLGRDAPPPYAGRGEMSKPFTIPVTSAEGFNSRTGVGLRKDGKTLWESDEYSSIRKVDKEGRFHSVYLKDRRNVFRIVDPRGRVQQIAGQTDFNYLDTSELDKGRVRLGAYDPAQVAFDTQKSRSVAPVVLASELSAFRGADADGNCRRDNRSAGIYIRTAYRYKYGQGTLHIVSDRMKPINAEPAYFPIERAEDRAGQQICEG